VPVTYLHWLLSTLAMPEGTLSIAELLRPEAIAVGIPGSTKEEAIDGILGLLDGHAEIADVERVRADVWAREEQMSTGVGKGLGLPHARSGAVRGTVVAFATTAEPIPFGAIDGEPVRLLFLLIGPETARQRHVQLLGRVSRLLNRESVRDELLEAAAPEQVIDVLRRAEEDLGA
jgi:mannitol/fructose-specific phosphotransferase system IIA component (Ntr-type)